MRIFPISQKPLRAASLALIATAGLVACGTSAGGPEAGPADVLSVGSEAVAPLALGSGSSAGAGSGATSGSQAIPECPSNAFKLTDLAVVVNDSEPDPGPPTKPLPNVSFSVLEVTANNKRQPFTICTVDPLDELDPYDNPIVSDPDLLPIAVPLLGKPPFFGLRPVCRFTTGAMVVEAVRKWIYLQFVEARIDILEAESAGLSIDRKRLELEQKKQRCASKAAQRNTLPPPVKWAPPLKQLVIPADSVPTLNPSPAPAPILNFNEWYSIPGNPGTVYVPMIYPPVTIQPIR